MIRVPLLLAVCLASLSVSARAATLYGKVIEVNDGDTITIFNLNKPVIVRLMGVDAPDGQQPFAEVARQHLSDLVAQRFVSVEYSGFVQNNYLLGTVSYKEMDVGAQMIRDGVAWFDPQTSTQMSEGARQVYGDCERAARAERRGLWQDPDPVAPWKFKEQQRAAARSQPAASKLTSNGNSQTVLSGEDLFSGLAGSSRLPPAPASVMTQWQTLSPPKEHFTIMVPGIGNELAMELPVGTGVVKLSFWGGEFEGASYLVMWARGPNISYTDDAPLDDIRRALLQALNRDFQKRGIEFESRQQRNLKLGPLTGVQYELAASNTPGVMRAFSRRVGDDRELYLLVVLNANEKSASTAKFLSSFSFDRKK